MHRIHPISNYRSIFTVIASSYATKRKMAQKTCYAAGKNKHVILDVLRTEIESLREGNSEKEIKVLEIASGTGEHACLFATNIHNLLYQPSEPEQDMHDSIGAWTLGITVSKVNPPITIDVNDPEVEAAIPINFSNSSVDMMICINMIHISPFHSTESLFKLASACLRPGGKLLTYGPYRVMGEMVESNVAFDQSLKARNPEWGIRDLEAVMAVAQEHNMELRSTIAMPSNNLSLVFCKIGHIVDDHTYTSK